MRAALLLAVVLLAPLALAGDEASPEMTDPPQDAPTAVAWGDIVAGWFNDTATDIAFTMKLASYTAPPPNYVWGVQANIGPQLYGWYLFNSAGQGGAQFFYSKWDAQQGPTDPHQGQGEVRAAAGTITMLIPKAYALNGTAPPGVTQATAYTGVFIGDSVTGMVPFGQFQADDSASGKDYLFARGGPGVANPPGNNTPGNTTNPNGTQPTDGGAQPAKTPFPAAGLAVAVVGLAALARRKR
ncbi:MAG: hypothetical protein LC624_07900 [Halobacteriales archaeon]|nr:hypothetical protein [Halobacteriales archaeon]